MGEHYFDIQPQSVRINDHDEIYIANTEHFLGQVLYRYDRIALACECRTDLRDIQYEIYWSINAHRIDRLHNRTTIELIIDNNTVQAPITSATCHCIFIRLNDSSRQIKRQYQYQLYIGKHSLNMSCH
jgi:hypothetical protein